MIAYNSSQLDNADLQHAAEEARAKGLIADEGLKQIRDAHPYTLYSPNAFARIGLFILTVVGSAGVTAFLLLLGLDSGEKGAAIVCLFAGLGAIFGQELFIKSRKCFQAGVDDAFPWIAGALIMTGINLFNYHLSPSAEWSLILLLALAFAIRYADLPMSVVAYIALIGAVTNRLISGGAITQAILPFLIILINLLIYFGLDRIKNKRRLRHYSMMFPVLQSLSLAFIYLAGNYYVLDSIHSSPSGTGALSLGWFWWSWTALLPLLFIWLGLNRKDQVFLWLGLLLSVASIMTFRYYYHLLPAEVMLVIAGVVMIAGSYLLIRRLRRPWHGISSDQTDERQILASLLAEGLIAAETFQKIPTGPDSGVRFGGGSGGGGGAQGQF